MHDIMIKLLTPMTDKNISFLVGDLPTYKIIIV